MYFKLFDSYLLMYYFLLIKTRPIHNQGSNSDPSAPNTVVSFLTSSITLLVDLLFGGVIWSHNGVSVFGYRLDHFLI